jgi:hypothetical protein
MNLLVGDFFLAEEELDCSHMDRDISCALGNISHDTF